MLPYGTRETDLFPGPGRQHHLVLWLKNSIVSLHDGAGYWRGQLSRVGRLMASNADCMCLAILLALATPAQADTRTDYLLHCSGCHLSDGSGAPDDVPSLRDDLGRMITAPQGRGYLVRVPGSSQALLNDAKLAAVINWVLTEFNSATLADDFEPLTAEEVKRARSDVLMDPLKFRAEFWR